MSVALLNPVLEAVVRERDLHQQVERSAVERMLCGVLGMRPAAGGILCELAGGLPKFVQARGIPVNRRVWSVCRMRCVAGWRQSFGARGIRVFAVIVCPGMHFAADNRP
ncbi:hypothetical protein [Nocardia alni]|uniref:hypothetical protein n=1 Tax=Nocardia alni TaxID=2815723 RepID=UPI001C22AE17|nr:hypothetical protein [Nocardia alni]